MNVNLNALGNPKCMCCVSRPGKRAPAVTSHPQASTASATGTHAVGSSASELSGSAAAGGSAAAPAVPRETQATVPTAATSHQQGTVALALLVTMATRRMRLPFMVL